MPAIVIAGVGLARRATIVVAILTAIFGAVFVLWPELHAWNLRFLPFWYFGLGLLAASAVGEGLRAGSVWIAVRVRSRDPRDVRRIVMSAALVAVSLIVFGLLLFWADRLHGDRQVERFGTSDAVKVGAAQMLALNPGTSRSGITMTAARWLGFTRDAAETRRRAHRRSRSRSRSPR